MRILGKIRCYDTPAVACVVRGDIFILYLVLYCSAGCEQSNYYYHVEAYILWSSLFNTSTYIFNAKGALHAFPRTLAIAQQQINLEYYLPPVKSAELLEKVLLPSR